MYIYYRSGHMSSNLQQELQIQNAKPLVLSTITPEMEKDEPLLQENPKRFVMYPIQYQDIWQMYKKHEVCFYLII